MQKHILLLVDSYVSDRDPRHGSKFRLHVKAYKERGYKVGVVALMQRDYSLWDCLRRGGFMWEEREFDAPVIRNCEFYALTSKISYLQRMPVATRRLGPSCLKYYIKRHGRPDLIHAHGSKWCGYAANVVYRAMGIPYVLTEYTSNYARGTVKTEDMPLMRQAFAQASMRAPISESTGAVLENLFGDDVRPWTVVPNMVDDSLFVKRGKTAQGTSGAFTFFTVGRHDPVKGYDLLLEAFAKGFKGQGVRLRIGGSGLLFDDLKATAVALGIEAQVSFLGPLERERVAKELNFADAYVLSSHYETFGIPIIEAQACGVPVVATACGGPQQLIDASNGVLVEPKNVNALAEGMALIMRGYDEFDKEAIRERCLATYSPGAVMDQLETIYDSVLS
ncbi:glycosyltransferase [Pelagibius sp. Alg239-R121]|uniref:glycosyltransferase n=1 Tax=Pelagibius sp. Alg239-R121 TaxID=2993448 RepID=UPI0024A6EFD5|nr:glycosyltransferase [Pelagibius sp. Alg239-R121]